MSRCRHILARCGLILFLIMTGSPVHAQQVIYDDALENGWQSWGWASLNYSNAAPVHSGSDSISVTVASPYGAMYLHHAAFSNAAYSALNFWINPGPTGGQVLQVQATLNGTPQTSVAIGTLAGGSGWREISIPLSSLGVANSSSMDGFWIQDISGNSNVPAFYIDDISLGATAPPNPVTITVNASTPVHALSSRLLGLNTAIWDSSLASTATQALIGSAKFQILRYPGGSASDSYNWSTNKSDGNTWTWSAGTGAFAQLMLGSGSTGIITTNYGSGTPQMAAAWVAYFNSYSGSQAVIGIDAKGVNWQTAAYWANLRASTPLATDDGYNVLRIGQYDPLNVKYFEVGNECYGSWENDTHGTSGSSLTGAPHDAVTYAEYAEQFISAMKAVDPTIKVGCVAEPGQDTNPQTTSAVNLADGTTHSGWTAVMLATLASPTTNPTGVMPNFIIDHRYPQAPGSESDSGLLASTSGWPADATDLRTQITDYIGSQNGANIELDATETNDVYSNPGKQSVSLVNALYAADSIGMMGQTEFNELNWWDMRNGYDPNQNNSSSLYGWRNYGDYGLISSPGAPDGANTPYPPYYGFKLASHWSATGATSVQTTSGYGLLSSYGAVEPDGSLALLVINKTPTFAVNSNIALNGFRTSSTATVYSYGESNDLANGDLTSTSLVGVTFPFTYVFPPYSMTVIDFPTVFNPPTGLVVTATYASPVQFRLAWTPPSDALPTGYNIKRSTTSGGPYTTIASNVNATSSFTDYDTTLQLGQTYYYVISALHSGAESPNSNEVTARFVPDAPTGVNASNNLSIIRITWSVPDNYTPTGYNIYRSTTSGGPYTQISSNVSGLRFDDSTVTGGLYYYVVTGLYSSLESAYSNEAQGGSTFLPPNAPTNLVAVGGDGTVALTWTAPTGNVKPTGYNVYRATTSGGPYTFLQSEIQTTGTTDSTVTNGTTYYYVITAANQLAESPKSNEAAVSPNWATPGPPTALSATAGDSTATLTWTAPSGNIVPTGYNLYRSTTSGGGYGLIQSSLSGTTATDNTVTNGTTYTYVVTSLNHAVESGDSNQASASPNWQTPGVPTGLLAVGGDSTVMLTWTAPSGPVVPTGYNVYRSATSGGPFAIDLSNVQITSALDNGLADGVTYYYVITALNHTVESGQSAQAAGSTVFPSPSAPTNLTATAGIGQVGLSWTAPIGIVPTSYLVMRGAATGGPYTVIQSNVTGTAYTDNDSALQDGTTYYYVVAAINVTTQGPYSNEVSAVPGYPAPGAPSGLAATGASSTVALTWTAPGGTVTATGYNVFRSTNSGGPFTLLLPNVPVTSATDNTAVNGTTYFYVVTALNHGVQGPYSLQASATPNWAIPGPPVGLVATSGDGTVGLIWSAPGGTVIPTGYNVYRSISNSGPYSIVLPNVFTTSTNDGTVTNGTVYYYVVTSLNHTEESANSGQASAAPNYATPGAPIGLSATGGSGSVSLIWSVPGGTVVPTGYNVYRSTSSGSGYTLLLPNLTGTSATDSTAVNGTTYYYVVTALNHTVEGQYSNQASAIPNWKAPGIPIGLTAVGGDTTVALVWTTPTGPVTATAYNVYRSTTSGGPYVIDLSNVTSTSAMDSGLTDGVVYYYVVTALNHTAESGQSNQAAGLPFLTAPGAPTGLKGTVGVGTVALSWIAPAGIVPTGYVVQRATVTGGPYSVIRANWSGTTYNDTGLTSGITYYYVVAALNQTTQGPDSNELAATPLWPAPGAPTGLTATAGNAMITLSWSAPGGTVVPTSYAVYRSTASGGPYGLIVSGLATKSYTDTSAANGITYYYVIAAFNHTAQGPNSNVASATPLNPLPGPPSGLVAIPGNALAILTWTAPAGTVKSYTVLRATANGGPYSSVKTGVTSTTYTNTGLTNGVTYYYVVAAVNTKGTGPDSNQASALPMPPVPNAPTNLTANVSNKTVSLSWTAPTNTKPTSYNIQRAAVSGGPYSTIKSVTGTTYSNTGLTNGTAYYYVVSAVNMSGTSPNSNQASAVP